MTADEEEKRRWRAKAIEITLMAQIQFISLAVNQSRTIDITVGSFEMADRIFNYIARGDKHPEGLIG